MTRIIAVANPKGGTGKSTTTVALAAAAARDGLRTLVIELDSLGTTSQLSKIGELEDNDPKVALEMFTNQPTPPSALARTTIYSYDLVAANKTLAAAEQLLLQKPMGPFTLRTLFKRDEGLKKYDVVFIDTSANKTQILTAVLFAATHVIIPLQPTDATVKPLPDFLATIADINIHRADLRDPPLIHYGILYTMVKEGTRIQETVIRGIAQQLAGHPEIPVSSIHIPHSVAVGEAERAEAPVTIARPSHPVAQRYFEFWDSISGHTKTSPIKAVAV